MNKIKCRDGCVYSKTMNQPYPRNCVNCGVQELVTIDQKWRSKNGHAIASDVTDKIKIDYSYNDAISEIYKYEFGKGETDKITNKNAKNVSCENLTNAALLAEAVKVIEFYASFGGVIQKTEFGEIIDNRGQRARDFLAKVR